MSLSSASALAAGQNLSNEFLPSGPDAEGKIHLSARSSPSRMRRAADDSHTVRGPVLPSARNNLPSR